MSKRFIEMMKDGDFPLVVSLPYNDPSLARKCFEAGADAIKVHINVYHGASKNNFGSFDEQKEVLTQILKEAKGPVGVVLGGDLALAEKDFDKAVEAGFDFFSLFSFNASCKVLNQNKITRMLAPRYDWPLELVDQMKDCGAEIVEASVFGEEGPEFRISHATLLKYKNLVEHSKLPVLVPTQVTILPEEVKNLKAVGVSGIMIGVIVTTHDEENIVNKIKEFRKAIDEMKEA